MTDTRDDGGPAWPTQLRRPPYIGDTEYVPGMSLRDWFAGQALSLLNTLDIENTEPEPFEDTLSGAAYKVADAMLRARKEP